MWRSSGSDAQVATFGPVVPNIFGSCVRNLLRGGSQILGKKFVLSRLNGRAYEDRFLLGDINPDDGNSKILLNATTTLPDYTASHSKRQQPVFKRIESRWGGEIFRTRPDRLWGPPSLIYNG